MKKKKQKDKELKVKLFYSPSPYAGERLQKAFVMLLNEDDLFVKGARKK